MSTAFHPESDGQTEHITQVIESCLRFHCNYEWNHWASVLAMAEYAYNNSKHSATKISPLYAKSGVEPKPAWPRKILFRNPASELYGHYMKAVLIMLSEQLALSIEAMKKYYNRKRKDIEPFKPGELVMWNGRNIRSKYRCKKLEDNMYGRFEVVSTGKNGRYCTLRLPESWKIHPTSNIALLERYRGTDPKKQVVEIGAHHAGWKTEIIIPSGPSDDHVKKHVYMVKWEGFSHDKNTWETYANVTESSKYLLKDYYAQKPTIKRDGKYMRKKKT